MAKTHKNLYPNIAAFDALYHAWRRARKGKRYKPAAATFEQNLDAELLSLHRELTDGSYQPGGYANFTVHDPKRRKISAAPFRDRVVHHTLVGVLEPIYERKFIYDTYAVSVRALTARMSPGYGSVARALSKRARCSRPHKRANTKAHRQYW